MQTNFLTDIEISNFKSIEYALLKPKRINIFVGAPNSGKSNFLEAISLLGYWFGTYNYEMGSYKFCNDTIRYNTIDELFHYSATNKPVSVKTNRLNAIISYLIQYDTYHFAIGKSPNLERIFTSAYEKGLANTWNDFLKEIDKKFDDELNAYTQLGIDGKVSSTDFISHTKDGTVKFYIYKQPKSYSGFQGGFLKPNGENLFSIVKSNEVIREWIVDFFKDFNLKFLIDSTTKTFGIYREEKGVLNKISFELTPDTFRRMLYHLTAIASNKNSVILFEEPETHSFPPYIKYLAEEMLANDENQFFVSSHSPYLISTLIDSNQRNEVAVFKTSWKDFQTKITPLNTEEINLFSEGKGDIFFNLD